MKELDDVVDGRVEDASKGDRGNVGKLEDPSGIQGTRKL